MSKARVALIGCTPLSVALGSALRRALPSVEIVGHDRDAAAAQRAQASGAIHKHSWNIPAACEGASAIFIFGAEDELRLVLNAIRSDVAPGVLIAHVGGSLQAALEAARTLLPAEVSFFASFLVRSPLAQAESPLHHALWAIAPRAGANEADVEQFLALVRALEAVPVLIDPQEGDGMRLAVEALPVVLSAACMRALSADPAWRERQWVAGAEFADFTRMLEDGAEGALAQLLAAPQAAVHWLNQVMLACMALRDALAEADASTARAWLQEASARRAQWLADWRQGRAELAVPAEAPRASLLSFFLGERLAERLREKRQK
ncbi:MAG: prephenate dehydrogenase/arogenate dehydrogenase family protein [Thermoflexales bacterium]|nr:prephenate dehydrogenase/arogenate dehydrogenase family protein [Thermoflexales bacterium]